MSETVQYLVDVEGWHAEDSHCARLSNHLQNHCDKIFTNSKSTIVN